MRPYALYEIAEITNGRILSGDPKTRFTKVCIDSRVISNGDLFVAIVGERNDGHEFLDQVARKGATGAVVEKDMSEEFFNRHHGFGLLRVDSTIRALQALASHYRNSLDTSVIGITGSLGKTSTKDFVSSVLETTFTTYHSLGNLNSHIGLPLAILDAPSAEYTVLEMAMRKRGEIAELSKIARPKIGILTDISPSHVGVLGNIDEIALAKAELLEALPKEGLALLRGDNEIIRRVSNKAKCRIVYYGLSEACHYYPVDIVELGAKGSRFSVIIDDRKEEFNIAVPGKHQVENAMAAVALALELGISSDKIRQGLLNAKMSPMRMEVLSQNGITIINDAYNASPKSVKAALDLLNQLPGERKIAVLGDMLELGDYSIDAHREIGAYAVDKADYLIAIGELGTYTRESWISEKGHGPDSLWFNDKDDAAEYLSGFLKEGDVVLVKGSRSLGLETVVQSLTRRWR
jgi:UDP-N-acetylmuramoyl-tripeptide--D-alanyl-D-alanine ligase